MARGHQKLQSQAKAQEKAAKIKKQQGHSAVEQKKAAAKALGISCAVCKVRRCAISSLKFICIRFDLVFVILIVFLSNCQQSQMPDPKTYKQHFENKHPKCDMPAELLEIAA